MPTTISYEDFCDLAAPLAPPWFDKLTEPAREYVLALAWENCAWSRLTDERIRKAFEEAKLVKGDFRFYDEPMKSALERIYEKYTPGSPGFAREVFSQCGYGITLDRIQELGRQAKTPEEFHNLWENGPSL